jgi:tol-pal system protein YbgF
MRKHAAFLFPLLILSVTPARAADKQHLQMMAEIRLLQEQQQQLQQFLAGLQDTLKAVNTRLDEQAAATRKAMADQTLAVNNMGDNVRVLREKTDETNVRISSVSQEIEALRQALAQSQPSSAPPQPGLRPPPGPAPGPQQPPGASGVPPIGPSPQRMFETSYDDYTAGRFDLAIKGFQQFIQVYPKAPQAADAEYNIGQSYYAQSNWNEARDAYSRVVTDFASLAQGTTLADAYYKLGMTYERLNQLDAAKQAYQTVVQKYPDTSTAALANSALQRLNRR